MNPVHFSWKWGEYALPIEDQYACLGVEISEDFLGYTQSKTSRKGKIHVSETDAILIDSHLDPA